MTVKLLANTSSSFGLMTNGKVLVVNSWGEPKFAASLTDKGKPHFIKPHRIAIN